MLTPQEISERELVKAVFGGYDIAVVDDFLETISADYATLYKENAILKSKIKVLVEKGDEKELHEYHVDDLRFKRKFKKEKVQLSAEEMKELEKLEKSDTSAGL